MSLCELLVLSVKMVSREARVTRVRPRRRVPRRQRMRRSCCCCCSRTSVVPCQPRGHRAASNVFPRTPPAAAVETPSTTLRAELFRKPLVLAMVDGDGNKHIRARNRNHRRKKKNVRENKNGLEPTVQNRGLTLRDTETYYGQPPPTHCTEIGSPNATVFLYFVLGRRASAPAYERRACGATRFTEEGSIVRSANASVQVTP